jgi:hypothetical protein
MVLRFKWITFIITVLFLSILSRSASAQCVYLDKYGKMHTVSSPKEVPVDYYQTARCTKEVIEAHGNSLAKPQELDLGSSVRREQLSTPLGRIHLRWDRGVEKFFSRSPHRAVSDAVDTINRFLRRAGVIPYRLIPRELTEWHIVVMDENVPSEQVPSYLVNNCHPGWMTPPTNIYLVGQRVVAGCGGQRRLSQTEADQELSRVILHEFGHVVEYYLLNGMMGRDRARAEGFASWFEQTSSEFSRLIPSGSTRLRYMKLAKSALDKGYSFSQSFGGGAHDYAVASLLFVAIADRRGLDDVITIYEQYAQQKGRESFHETALKTVHWTEATLDTEMRKVANRYGSN